MLLQGSHTVSPNPKLPNPASPNPDWPNPTSPNSL